MGKSSACELRIELIFYIIKLVPQAIKNII